MRRWQQVLLIGLSAVVVVLIVVTVIIVVTPRSLDPVTTTHPSPALVVEEYLTALAEGDAEAARAMDTQDPNVPPYLHADRESFLTNDVMGAAIERISQPKALDVFADEERAVVEATFSLAEKSHSYQLGLNWDSGADRWQLNGSLAARFNVSSYIENIGESSVFGLELLLFTLAGVSPAALAGEGEDNALGYIAYPAVYELVVDIDESTLVDPAATPTKRQFIVLPGSDDEDPLDFPVRAR